MAFASKSEWAYFAGLIDGEGCIGINKFRIKNHYTYWRLRIQVTNTDSNICFWLKRELGGCVSTHHPHFPWSTRYVWAITGKKAGELLKKILPYLRIKKFQAELAIQFQFKRTAMGKLRAGDMLFLKECERKMHKLNAGGINSGI